jgi:pimeloyl-ACP methyl ester carboxylesterase
MNKAFKYLNTTINYWVYGEGQPVVLLHGFAEDSTIWNNQTSYLETHCRLIVPDLPGSGNSELLEGSSISMEDYADCIYALFNEEKIERGVLLGHSMGGYITLAFAEKYPAKVKSFGLVHSTAFGDSEEKKSTRKKGIELMKEYGVLPFIKNTTPNLFSATFKKNSADSIDALIKQQEKFTTAALVQYYTVMMNRRDYTVILEKSEVPVLFVIGSEDVAAPLPDLLQHVHLPKIAHIHILENVGHMSMLEAPHKLNNYLLKFINSP